MLILSPHRDDAVFSLAIAMRTWTLTGQPVRVLNVYTESEYAPGAPFNNRQAISDLRLREDLAALHFISPSIEEHSLGLLDAPVRLGWPLDQVMQPHAGGRVAPLEIQSLAELLQPFVRNDEFVFAPLGLGFHVDHWIVRQAAERLSPCERLCYYEDLPYATWTAEEDIIGFSNRLPPQVIQAPGSAAWKRSAVEIYRSQITADDAKTIADFSLRYGGGERYFAHQSTSASGHSESTQAPQLSKPLSAASASSSSSPNL